jgi:hypothetical protein
LNRHERDKATEFFKLLSPSDRFELGDQFVLGTFDWRNWLESKPSSLFLRELDRQRMLWEMSI